MKRQVVFFLAAVLLSVQAVPLRTNWYKLAPAPQPKGLSDFWHSCGQPSDHAKIITSSVKINPDPPKRGPITIAGNFTLDEEVTGGQIAVNLLVDTIQFYNETLDLCDTGMQFGLSCPLTVGSHTISINQDIPYEAPPGNYDGTAKLIDQNGQELTCVAAKFKFS